MFDHLQGITPLSTCRELARNTDSSENGEKCLICFLLIKFPSNISLIIYSFYKEEKLILKISQRKDMLISPFQGCYP